MELILNLFGNYDENVNLIQKSIMLLSSAGEEDIKITGDEENVYYASKAVDALISLANKGKI